MHAGPRDRAGPGGCGGVHVPAHRVSDVVDLLAAKNIAQFHRGIKCARECVRARTTVRRLTVPCATDRPFLPSETRMATRTRQPPHLASH
jgi:hypothetical protein